MKQYLGWAFIILVFGSFIVLVYWSKTEPARTKGKDLSCIETKVNDYNIPLAECLHAVGEFWKKYEDGTLNVITGGSIPEVTDTWELALPELADTVRKHLEQDSTTDLVIVLCGPIESNKDGLFDRHTYYDIEKKAGEFASKPDGYLSNTAKNGACIDIAKLSILLGHRFKSIGRIYSIRQCTDSNGDRADVVLCFQQPYVTVFDVLAGNTDKSSWGQPIWLYDTAYGKTIRYYSHPANRRP